MLKTSLVKRHFRPLDIKCDISVFHHYITVHHGQHTLVCTNAVVLTFDDDHRPDEDGEGDTDSADASVGAGQGHHKMPHVEMVAPAHTLEDEPPAGKLGAYFSLQVFISLKTVCNIQSEIFIQIVHKTLK